jgi:O-antigen ligase
MAQRGVIRSAVLAVAIVVPMYAAYAAPFALLGFAIREFIDQRWLSGALLAVCAGLAYVALQFAGRRFVSWAETRRQAAQH